MATVTPTNVVIKNPSQQMRVLGPAANGSGFDYSAGRTINFHGLKHRVFEFTGSNAPSTTDICVLGIKQIVALAWQAMTAADEALAYVNDQATGTVQFIESTADASSGYLHVWSRD